MARRNWELWVLTVFLVVHVVLGVYWSVVVPIWESYDEIGHYYYVHYLAVEHHLPPPGTKLVDENDEVHQPPLYYALAAIPVAFVNVHDGVEPRLNPYMWSGPELGGWNRVIHDAAGEAWPYHGTVLAVHLARWVSVLLGAMALLFTFLAARTLAPDQVWVRWGAALTLALWPHFRFSTAVINNDIMVTTAFAVVTWLLVRLAAAKRPRALDVLALCGAGGLALLSKGNGLALLPPLAVGLLVSGLSARPLLRRRLRLGLVSGFSVSALAVGWWYTRNASNGLGVFGGQRSLKTLENLLALLLGQRPLPSVGLLLPTLGSGLHSLWANLGWGNIRLPAITYQVAGLWAMLGAAGLLVWLYRRPKCRQAISVGMLVLVALSLIVAMLLCNVEWGRKGSLEGRYILPALPALCILISLGWTTLLPEWGKTLSWTVTASALAALAILTPPLYIEPVYAAPSPLTDSQVEEYTPVMARMGDFVELVGYRIEDRFVDPDGKLRLELAWRTLSRADADYTLAVQVFDAQRHLLGEVHRFPGRGTLSTGTWPVGNLYLEELLVPIDAKEELGQLAWVEVSFYDRDGLRPVATYDGAGRRIGDSLRLASIRVRSAQQPNNSEAAPGPRFGEAIWLTAGQAELQSSGQQLGLSLTWVVTGPIGKDYTLSLQLRDERNTIVAQVDGEPGGGAYPTSLWEVGERMEDKCTLALPANLAPHTYTLYACLYEFATMERTPVADQDGMLLINSEAPLLRVLVRESQAPVLQAVVPLVRVR